MKKIIFTYLETGGGHKAPAKVISQTIEEKYPETKCLLVNTFFNHKFLKRTLESSYGQLVNKPLGIFFYNLFYHIGKAKIIQKFISNLIAKTTLADMLELLNKENPDLIVILHPFLATQAIEATKEFQGKTGKSIKIVEIVLDCQPHSFWFIHKKDIHYVLAIDQQRISALEYGVPPELITVINPPINPKIQKIELSEIKKIKENLGLNPKFKTLLLIGGGEGLPNGEKILKELLSADLGLNILVLTARSEEYLKKVQSVITKNPQRKDKIVKIFHQIGHDSQPYNVCHFLNIADLILTKAGFSMTMELLILGKPPFIVSYIKGQEDGNVCFIREKFLGYYLEEPKKIAEKIKEIFSSKEESHLFQEAIKRENIKNGNQKIANFLINLVG